MTAQHIALPVCKLSGNGFYSLALQIVRILRIIGQETDLLAVRLYE